MKNLKICASPTCSHNGKGQSLSNFYIKSRHKGKVYYDKACKDCKRKTTSPMKSDPRVIMTDYLDKQLTLVSYEQILEEYNQRRPDHILSINELESAVRTFSLLSKWSQNKE